MHEVRPSHEQEEGGDEEGGEGVEQGQQVLFWLWTGTAVATAVVDDGAAALAGRDCEWR